MGALMAGALAAVANAYSGRRLTGAGLVVDDQGSQALIQDSWTVAWPLVRRPAQSTVQSGLVTEVQRDRLCTDVTETAEWGPCTCR